MSLVIYGTMTNYCCMAARKSFLRGTFCLDRISMLALIQSYRRVSSRPLPAVSCV
jgi:hypothetical protein